MCTAWAGLCRNKTRPSISLASFSHGPRAGPALSEHRGNPASKRPQMAAPCPAAACGQPMLQRAGGTWPPGGDDLVWERWGCAGQGGGSLGAKPQISPLAKGWSHSARDSQQETEHGLTVPWPQLCFHPTAPTVVPGTPCWNQSSSPCSPR